MKTKKLSHLFTVICLSFLCASCGDDTFDNTKPEGNGNMAQLIIGTWEATETYNGGAYTLTFTFKKDATGTLIEDGDESAFNYSFMTVKEVINANPWIQDYLPSEIPLDGIFLMVEYVEEDGSTGDDDFYYIMELTSNRLVLIMEGDDDYQGTTFKKIR